jgi:phage terminase large subunit
VAEFWAHEHLSGRDDVLWINSTFRDNPYLPEPIINDLLLRKNNPNYANWWRVYGEGLTGMIEGLVYPSWQQVSSVPADAALLGYGLDFGYTNDPTALIAIYKYQGEIYLHELIYQTGLLSSDIIRLMKQLKVSTNRPIIADSADPRTIRELQLGGFNVRGVKKEHIYESIDFSKKYLKYVTKDSTNLIKELRNYMWLQKDGKFINEPINAYDHGCDAFRYGFLGLFSRKPIQYI